MYIITSFCCGQKYLPIREKWLQRIKKTCKHAKDIRLYDKIYVSLENKYGWWDVLRLNNILLLSSETNIPVVQVDMDIIMEKDIQPLVDLCYDFIISTEIGGNKAYPTECSSVLGFGVCSGFYILKPSAASFFKRMLHLMYEQIYGSYSDQVNLMHYIMNNKHEIREETCVFDGTTYTNKIISIDGIKICVLDFELVIRDPVFSKGQFANHINIDNVGGTMQFLRYFDEPLESLPLSCRCGKKHLGNSEICIHVSMRSKKSYNIL